MSTAIPSWRAPIRKSAATTVSGFGQRHTSAIAASTTLQLTTTDTQLRRSSISRRSRTSSRVSASRHCSMLSTLVMRRSSPRGGDWLVDEPRVDGAPAMRDAELGHERCPGAAAELVVLAHRRDERVTLAGGADLLGQQRVEHQALNHLAARHERLDHRLLGRDGADAPRALRDPPRDLAVRGADGVGAPKPTGARFRPR